jgi:hypothetical protein
MANGAGRVPCPAEVNIFNREISRDQKIILGANAQDGTVIADSAQHGALADRVR